MTFHIGPAGTDRFPQPLLKERDVGGTNGAGSGIEPPQNKSQLETVWEHWDLSAGLASTFCCMASSCRASEETNTTIETSALDRLRGCHHSVFGLHFRVPDRFSNCAAVLNFIRKTSLTKR